MQVSNRQFAVRRIRETRLGARRRSDGQPHMDQARVEGPTIERYVPTLRGYPIDPFFANRGR